MLIRARGGNTSATPSSLSRKVKKENEHGATESEVDVGQIDLSGAFSKHEEAQELPRARGG